MSERTIIKCVLTGASGFVGQATERVLREAWIPVVSVLREHSDPQSSYRLGSRVRRGNVLSRESLRPAFKEPAVDAVVHLVGIIEERDENSFRKTHVEGTANVLALAKEIGVKKFIHMSAQGTRQDAVSSYHKTKWEAEELVRQSGLNYTILRPSVIFGEDCEFLLTLLGLVKMPLFIPLIGGGESKLQPVFVGDVARFIHRCLVDERTDNNTYSLGGPDVFTFRQMLEAVARRVDREKPMFPLPLALGRLMVGLNDNSSLGAVHRFFHEWVLGVKALNSDQLQMMQEDNVCDMKPAAPLVDWKFTQFSSWLPTAHFVHELWRPWKGRYVKDRLAGPPAPATVPPAPPAAPKPTAPGAAGTPPKPAAAPPAPPAPPKVPPAPPAPPAPPKPPPAPPAAPSHS